MFIFKDYAYVSDRFDNIPEALLNWESSSIENEYNVALNDQSHHNIDETNNNNSEKVINKKINSEAEKSNTLNINISEEQNTI